MGTETRQYAVSTSQKGYIKPIIIAILTADVLIIAAILVAPVSFGSQIKQVRSEVGDIRDTLTGWINGQVLVMDAPPSEQRFDVASVGVSRGPHDAPVTIVEFSHFQCPFCASLQPTLEQARQQYGNKLRFVYRHFPLTAIHPDAWKAAEASLCADEQGKFWEIHDAMFAEQDGLAIPGLKAMARRLGLDGAAFDQCLDSGRYYDAVEADVHAGNMARVSGTPAMLVNGRPLKGAVPLAEIVTLIDNELSR